MCGPELQRNDSPGFTVFPAAQTLRTECTTRDENREGVMEEAYTGVLSNHRRGYDKTVLRSVYLSRQER